MELEVFLLKDTSNQVFFGFPAFDESGTGANFLGLIGTETPVRQVCRTAPMTSSVLDFKSEELAA